MLLDLSNETSWIFPALKSTSHFLPQPSVLRRSDSSSEANQGLIQEINLGGGSCPDNFLPTELGAWGAFWVSQMGSGAFNGIQSYLRLRICLILMYLQVKICKLLCLYIVFLRFPFTYLLWNWSWLQIGSNSYHMCFHSKEDICQVWARLICLHR